MQKEIMALLKKIEPDWSYTPAGVTLTHGVEALREVERQVAELLHTEAQSRVGARLVELAHRYPFVAKVTLELSVSGEYDDSGGTFAGIRLFGQDVEFKTQPPPELSDGDDLALEDLCATMAEGLSEGGNLDEFYLARGRDFNDYEDLTIVVDFATIAELMGSEKISGKEAYGKLFPAVKKK